MFSCYFQNQPHGKKKKKKATVSVEVSHTNKDGLNWGDSTNNNISSL